MSNYKPLSSAHVLPIQSRSNPRVKDLIDKKDQYYIFEGEKLVKDILNRSIPIQILIIEDSQYDIASLPSRAQVNEIWVASPSVIQKISSLKEKSSFIAVISIIHPQIDFKSSSIIIGLDSIQDPANAGTVFRCAAAFGIQSIILSGPSVNPTNSKFIRAAQNAIFDVPFQKFPNIDTAINKARSLNSQIHIYLTSSHPQAESVTPENVQFPCIIWIGNEGSGLDAPLFQKYPSIFISQTHTVESLNAGVSACILMHELQKRIN